MVGIIGILIQKPKIITSSCWSSSWSPGGGAPGAAGLQEGFTNLMPMMEGMMQSLLSKDLLYPAMKELAEKVSDPICILLIFSSLDGL